MSCFTADRGIGLFLNAKKNKTRVPLMCHMASRRFQLQAFSGNPLKLCAVRGGTTAFPSLARGGGG